MYVRVRFPMLTASSYHCAGMIPGPFFKQIIATVLPVYKCILFLPFGATCTITYFSVQFCFFHSDMHQFLAQSAHYISTLISAPTAFA